MYYYTIQPTKRRARKNCTKRWTKIIDTIETLLLKNATFIPNLSAFFTIFLCCVRNDPKRNWMRLCVKIKIKNEYHSATAYWNCHILSSTIYQFGKLTQKCKYLWRSMSCRCLHALFAWWRLCFVYFSIDWNAKERCHGPTIAAI